MQIIHKWEERGEVLLSGAGTFFHMAGMMSAGYLVSDYSPPGGELTGTGANSQLRPASTSLTPADEKCKK